MSTSLFLEDVNQWYEQYEVASPKEQYQQLVELLSTPLDPDYVNNKSELGDVLIEMQSLLEGSGLWQEALSLTKLVQEHQPAFYQKEFCYLGNFLLQYGLFHKDDELIDNSLGYYKQDPVTGIDMLLSVFNDLRLYDEHERAVDLSREAYKPVATSSKLMGGSEMEFGLTVLADLFGNAYKKLKHGQSIDWDAFKTEAESFGLVPESLPLISGELSGQRATGEALVAQFKDDRNAVLQSLFPRFQMRMYDQRQLSFVCGQTIWLIVLEFLQEPERLKSKKKLSLPENFFNFNSKQLDRHIAQLLGSFISDRNAEGFTVLWGLPHVYEFLLAEGLIDESVYDGAIAAVSVVKQRLLSKWPRPLWYYSFVHHWGKPDYQTEEDFEAEAKRFADSIKEFTPLSEEPSEPFSLEKSLGGLTGAIAKNWASSPAFSEPLPNVTASSNPQASIPSKSSKPKSSKPRKSGLSEIKSLTKKSKNKKKKKKGF
ncbi:MAG: hypothetical protein AAGD25_27690 [Cyanobacteria bacterium P01_F01_bin.150]